ncbi:S1C family serine protease [Pseudonocardia acaciae]|uniref:S1C family serine protease n=1 Tax=Pseudonocardia acaciae TaxID=551276 RepID=UPI00068404C6|nr:trypsin-like peptidase domain-containing protein [Pseudonocardia acaciae]
MSNTPVEPYGRNPYQTTPYGTTTPYGQLPPPEATAPGLGSGSPPPGMPPPGMPPPGMPPAPPEGPRPRRGRRIAGMVAVAVVAAAVGGGVGGAIGHQGSSPSSSAVGTLNQPLPPAGDLPAGAVSSVAQHVLPSVVQLQGAAGEGSGVVLSSDGLILTNAHVLSVARGGQLIATFQNGDSKPVREVGRDTRADLAVVRAQDVSGLTPIELGNSDGLKVGQQVIAVGSPLGLAGTVTSGIVSALNRPVETSDAPSPGGGAGGGGGGDLGGLLSQAPPTSVMDAVQTDAAINPGNSGGPLVDMQGRIVGINSAIARNGSTGLGFAIPINQAKRIADELVAHGKANQAQLGVSVRDSTPSGAQLMGVQPDSAAAKAGLKPGDVVTKIGDRRVGDADALVAAINSATPGSNVTLTVTSGAGEPRTVPVTLGSVPAD